MKHFMIERKVKWYDIVQKSNEQVRVHYVGTVKEVSADLITALVEDDKSKEKVVVDTCELTEI